MGISKDLTGTPWHVEHLSRDEDDSKRHRSRCIYRFKSAYGYRCAKISHCIGSAHCPYYREGIREKVTYKVPKTTKTSSQNKNNTIKSNKQTSKRRTEKNVSNQNPFPVGSFVKHAVFGHGRVKSIKGKYVRIAFDSGKVADFDIDICLAKRVLKVVST